MATLSGSRVLVVEDDKLLSSLIVRKLKAENCNVLYAANGEDALKALEKETPDLILLDILLPGIDGFEVLKRVKENASLRDVPVIILSNLGQESDIEQGKKLGAVTFLVKASLTLDEITKEIGRVVTERAKK